MKKILLTLILCVSVACGWAQGNDSTIIYIDIPKKMNIKDKIILANQSKYTILQAVVALVEDGRMNQLAMSELQGPGAFWTIAEYADNGLKILRGKRIAVKVKGTSEKFANNNQVSVNAGWYGRVRVKDSDAEKANLEKLKELDPKTITYKFDATIAERDHDLYIYVTSKGENGKGPMDF